MQIRNPSPVNTKVNQSGQGLVEYVLLLFVIAALATTLSVALKPVKEKIDFILADYIYCLIDEGELPAFGGESTITDCQKEFSGKMDAINSKSNSSKSAQNENDANEKDSNKDKNKNAKNDDGSSGRNGSYAASQASITNSRNFRPKSTNADQDGATAAQTSGQNDPNAGNSKLLKVGPATTIIIVREKKLSVGLAGLVEEEREKLKKREKKISHAATVEEAGIENKSKKLIVKPPERKIADADLESPPWDMGRILRILIIIAIIVALVLFVGGQLVQINRSME
jgi:hypothetical protein